MSDKEMWQLFEATGAPGAYMIYVRERAVKEARKRTDRRIHH